jgi:hypothetical protein
MKIAIEQALEMPNARKNELDCCVEGCMEPHLAKGFCNAHYHQWRKENNKWLIFRYALATGAR